MFGKKSALLSLFILTMLLLKTYTKRYISNFNRVITFTLCITHAFIRKGKNNWDLLFILWIWIWPTDVWMKFFFPRNMYHTCKHLCHLRKPSINFFSSFLWFIITQTVGCTLKKMLIFDITKELILAHRNSDLCKWTEDNN